MNPRILNDPHQLASEYVLGTLSAATRAEVEQALPYHTELRRAVHYWEERLLPLTALAEPLDPSPGLWPRIAGSLDAATATATAGAPAAPAPRRTPPNWWQRLDVWRGLAAGGFAAAAIMAVVVGLRLGGTPSERYMVVLAAPQSMAPGWIVQTGASGKLRLTPLAGTTVPSDKSLQLWTKADGWAGPVSLGLVKPGQEVEVALDKLPPLQPNQLFEITLEPYQGSPLNRPTGPILYIGRAVKMI